LIYGYSKEGKTSPSASSNPPKSSLKSLLRGRKTPSKISTRSTAILKRSSGKDSQLSSVSSGLTLVGEETGTRNAEIGAGAIEDVAIGVEVNKLKVEA
jgi:hypothetical protein